MHLYKFHSYRECYPILQSESNIYFLTLVIPHKIIMEEKCYEIKYLRKFYKNIFIYHRFDENNEEIFSYESILKAVDEVLEYFHQHGIEKKVGIGINMPENSVEGCVLLLRQVIFYIS